MIRIKLSYRKRSGEGDLFALIDESDSLAADLRWRAQRSSTGSFYAVRALHGTTETTYLHRVLMNPPDGYEVDHRNGDTLDCRRANLRVSTHQQNSSNVRMPSHNTSGFKGVSKAPKGRWRAFIKVDQRHIHLGAFDSKVEAAEAYDSAARSIFGEFARLNFPVAGEQGARP